MSSVSQMDAPLLERALRRGHARLGLVDFLDEIVGPLLHQIGSLWQEGEVRVAEEHLVTGVVRDFLSTLAIGPVGRRDATGIVLATPTAQIHDLGLQMAATVARVAGYDVTYLGCGLPSEEIVACIERTKSRALALSLVYPHRDDQLVREFARLHRLLPPGVTIAVGGQAAPHYEVDLRKIRARIFTSLREFQHWLDDGLAGRSESGIARIPGRERPGEVE